jgi:hypothetical protein
MNASILPPSVDASAPPTRRMVLTLLLVWTGWFIANLAANGLFFIAAHGHPGLRLPAEIQYFSGVSISGIVIPYHLCRKWGLDLPLLPGKRSAGFWLGTLLFLALAVFLGIQAMTDQGMSLQAAFAHPAGWILAPLPVFIPTMIAYTLLWYGLMLRGWERVFGGGFRGRALAIPASALLYGLYHFASVDEIFSLPGMLEEILITTLIGIGFGIFVVFSRSLLAAFLINWILNWFVFTPLDTFHPPAWQWPLASLVLAAIWLVYRYGWVGQDRGAP